MTISAETIAALVDRHFVPLTLWAGRRCSCAEDLVQEAFCQLAVQGALPDRPIAWLYRVVKNLASNERTRTARRAARERAIAGREAIHDDPAAGLIADELLQAVTELDDVLREVLTARSWGELTFDEIGGLCGISAATACRRYQQALEILRNKVEQPWPTSIR